MIDEQEPMNRNHETPTSTTQSADRKDSALCYQIGTSLVYYHAEHPRTNPEPQARRVLLQDLAAHTICAGCRKPIN